MVPCCRSRISPTHSSGQSAAGGHRRCRKPWPDCWAGALLPATPPRVYLWMKPRHLQGWVLKCQYLLFLYLSVLKCNFLSNRRAHTKVMVLVLLPRDNNFIILTEYCHFYCISVYGDRWMPRDLLRRTNINHCPHSTWLDNYWNNSDLILLRIPALTHKVLHHGRVMMRRRSQTQQLLTSRHCGVVDGLDVDVVSLQQSVTHLGVQLSITHLQNWSWKGDRRCMESI